MKEDHERGLSLFQNGSEVFYYYSREWRNNDGERVKDEKNKIIIDSQQNVIGILASFKEATYEQEIQKKENCHSLENKLVSTDGLRRDSY